VSFAIVILHLFFRNVVALYHNVTSFRYAGLVGRKRLHGDETAAALLETAERIVENEGVDALTVRRVAEGAGTTTRAVYSVYGSKEGLLVALGRRAFEYLRVELEARPETDDPAADLVEAGVDVFRRLAVEHPTLLRIGLQWDALLNPGLAAGFRDDAREALEALRGRVARLELGGRAVPDATREFHALCEGLAAMELRGILPDGGAERVWRDALTTLVRGFALPREA
jgi:AcrR family transcriptional regulator